MVCFGCYSFKGVNSFLSSVTVCNVVFVGLHSMNLLSKRLFLKAFHLPRIFLHKFITKMLFFENPMTIQRRQRLAKMRMSLRKRHWRWDKDAKSWVLLRCKLETSSLVSMTAVKVKYRRSDWQAALFIILQFNEVRIQ